jgi:putative transposase
VPRRPAAGTAGVVFHVVNRAIEGQLLFRDFGEYLAFLRLLARALERVPTRLLAYCLMPNHWHLVLWPTADGELTAFVRWLTAIHARNLHRWRGSEGRGAVYQSRFRASAVDTERYFYTAVRYVERNPIRGGLVARAEEWLWSSASPTTALQGIHLTTWPLTRPLGWSSFLNDEDAPAELALLRRRTHRNQGITQPHTTQADLAIPSQEGVAVLERTSEHAQGLEYADPAPSPKHSPEHSPEQRSHRSAPVPSTRA